METSRLRWQRRYCFHLQRGPYRSRSKGLLRQDEEQAPPGQPAPLLNMTFRQQNELPEQAQLSPCNRGAKEQATSETGLKLSVGELWFDYVIRAAGACSELASGCRQLSFRLERTDACFVEPTDTLAPLWFATSCRLFPALRCFCTSEDVQTPARLESCLGYGCFNGRSALVDSGLLAVPDPRLSKPAAVSQGRGVSRGSSLLPPSLRCVS